MSTPARRARKAVALAIALAWMAASAWAQQQSHARLDEASSPSPSPGGSVEFDPLLIRGTGISGAVADYLGRAPRLTPGQALLDYVVNGRAAVRALTRIEPGGTVCLTPELLHAIGLRLQEPQASGCVDLESRVQPSSLRVDPGESRVYIDVAEEHLAARSGDPQFSRGGAGAMASYRLTDFSGSGAATRFRNTYLDSEIGINLEGWVLRSRQSFVRSDGLSAHEWQSGFVQKNFGDPERQLRVGRIATIDPIYSGLPIDGVTWSPEFSIRTGRSSRVEGIASTRARVEIRQSGMLIHSTVVPPGPFSLADFAPLSSISDLEVRVLEEPGQASSFIVPASQIQLGAESNFSNGYYLSAGRPRAEHASNPSAQREALVVAGSSWRISRSASWGGSLLSATRYQALGARGNWQPAPNWELGLIALGSRAARSGDRGALVTASTQYAMGSTLRLGATVSKRSAGYRDFEQRQIDDSADLAREYTHRTSLSVGANLGRWGNASVSLNRQLVADGQRQSGFALGYNNSFRWADLAINAGRQYAGAGDPAPGAYAHVTVNIPLDASFRLTGYSRREGSRLLTGLSGTARIADQASLTAGIESSSAASEAARSLSVDWAPRYLSLAASVNQPGGGATYRSLGISGSVIVGEQGVAFSPMPVGDTFGMIKVGQLPGVAIDTSMGTVWTGHDGVAALPQINAFRNARADVRVATLPDDVEVSGDQNTVRAARGSVVAISVPTRVVRRLLMEVTLADGSFLPAGAGIAIGEDGDFVTVAGTLGQVMFPDFDPGVAYHATLADGSSCRIRLGHLDPTSTRRRFERGRATCTQEAQPISRETP